ncbi:MAG: Stf0 family sulfotransferase [Streptosporangiaceae bacterium]
MSEPAASAATCYAICALPRSGSWLLTLGLEDTGLAGTPRPYLCGLPASEPAPGRTRMESIRAAFTVLRRRHAGSNGVFGLKLESTDLPDLMTWSGGDGSFTGTAGEFLSALLPGLRYVYLTRHDKTRQALSLLRGLHELRWMQTSDAVEPGDWTPDMQHVGAIRQLLVIHEARWEAFFSATGAEPHRLSYEQLARGDAAYQHAILGVLRFLGIPARQDLPLPAPRLRKQAGQRTDEWAARYEAWQAAHDSAAGSSLPPALDQVAALPRQAHLLLGDGRLTLDDALRLAQAAGERPVVDRVLTEMAGGRPVDEALRSVHAAGGGPRLGSQLLRAMGDDDDTTESG